MDTNKDGKLGKDEAQGFVRENFDRLDGNKDGFVGADEILPPGISQPGTPGSREQGGRFDPRQLEANFDRIDANSDGKLTKDEIPEGERGEFLRRMLERSGADSISKEQLVRMTAQFGGGRPGEPGRPGQPGPGSPPGGGRPPLFVALDADNDGELSSGEIEASSKALLKLDRNSDGKLTREELFPGSPDGPPRDRPADRPSDRPGDRRPGEGRPGPGRGNPEEFQARLKEADKNGDGKLSKDEAPPMLQERFDRIDANSDGQLDADELRQMFQRLREGGDRRPEGRRPEGDRPEGGRPDAPRRE
jgi:Ca2+-binding EF-hand superfamily protein